VLTPTFVEAETLGSSGAIHRQKISKFKLQPNFGTIGTYKRNLVRD
jgi:hypothetical protein